MSSKRNMEDSFDNLDTFGSDQEVTSSPNPKKSRSKFSLQHNIITKAVNVCFDPTLEYYLPLSVAENIVYSFLVNHDITFCSRWKANTAAAYSARAALYHKNTLLKCAPVEVNPRIPVQHYLRLIRATICDQNVCSIHNMDSALVGDIEKPLYVLICMFLQCTFSREKNDNILVPIFSGPSSMGKTISTQALTESFHQVPLEHSGVSRWIPKLNQHGLGFSDFSYASFYKGEGNLRTLKNCMRGEPYTGNYKYSLLEAYMCTRGGGVTPPPKPIVCPNPKK